MSKVTVKNKTKQNKKLPKWIIWPRDEKLDINHLTCTHPHQTHPLGTQGGWLSLETEHPITLQRCHLEENLARKLKKPADGDNNSVTEWAKAWLGRPVVKP